MASDSQADRQTLRAIQDFRVAQDRATALHGQLEGAYADTVLALAHAVEARDGTTGEHVERVLRLCRAMGEALEFSGAALKRLEFAAVLQDVGKIGIPDAILLKSGPLNAEEMALARTHAALGRSILQGVAFLAPVVDAIAGHHEKWDGTGYPAGLAGEAIPLAARIIAVADSYDAMISDRPYRAALPEAAARAELRRAAGTQFDPRMVAVFLAGLAADGR